MRDYSSVPLAEKRSGRCTSFLASALFAKVDIDGSAACALYPCLKLRLGGLMRGLAKKLAAVLLIASSPAAAAVAADSTATVVVAMDHVAISVADADKSASFYKEVFGFRQVPAPVPMARWLVMANGVMLHIVGNRTAPSSHSRWDHLALACADMDSLIAKLDARHISWTNMEGGHSPQVRSDGVKQIFIQDPDGYWIEINDSLKTK